MGNPISYTDPLGLMGGGGNHALPTDPRSKFPPETREETMRRICKYSGPPWDGHVPRDPSNWHDPNQRNAEHYYFGNELGGMMGPFGAVAVGIWEVSKYARYPFGTTTKPTALGLEMGMTGVADGWISHRPSPEECKCLK